MKKVDLNSIFEYNIPEVLIKQKYDGSMLDEGMLSRLGASAALMAPLALNSPNRVERDPFDDAPKLQLTVSKPARTPDLDYNTGDDTPASTNSVARTPLSNQEAARKAIQLNILARTIYAEAQAEGDEGMRAVASVLWRRGGGDPSRMVAAAKAPKQFSCWNGMTANDWKNFRIKRKTGPAWETASELALDMVNGDFQENLRADHYYNPNLANPRWARGQQGFDIGNHRFMRLNNRRSR